MRQPVPFSFLTHTYTYKLWQAHTIPMPASMHVYCIYVLYVPLYKKNHSFIGLADTQTNKYRSMYLSVINKRKKERKKKTMFIFLVSAQECEEPNSFIEEITMSTGL